jgi:hypothetical protein
MYKYFGIDIKNQKIDDEQVPRNLKELLEKNPELWKRITDIKFDDGTTIHQTDGLFNNETTPNNKNVDIKDNDQKLFSHYAVNMYQSELNNYKTKEYYYLSSMSFKNGKLQSEPSIIKQRGIDSIPDDFILPAVIIQNGNFFKNIGGMSYFWFDNGIPGIKKLPYYILQNDIYNPISYRDKSGIVKISKKKDEEVVVSEFFPLLLENRDESFFGTLIKSGLIYFLIYKDKPLELLNNLYKKTIYKKDIKIEEIYTYKVISTGNISKVYYFTFENSKFKLKTKTRKEFENGKFYNKKTTYYYNLGGELHREEGPAVIEEEGPEYFIIDYNYGKFIKDKSKIIEEKYFLNNKEQKIDFV